jgi:hypothetical protein
MLAILAFTILFIVLEIFITKIYKTVLKSLVIALLSLRFKSSKALGILLTVLLAILRIELPLRISRIGISVLSSF